MKTGRFQLSPEAIASLNRFAELLRQFEEVAARLAPVMSEMCQRLAEIERQASLDHLRITSPLADPEVLTGIRRGLLSAVPQADAQNPEKSDV